MKTEIRITDKPGKSYIVEFHDRRGENWKKDISSYILSTYHGKHSLEGFDSIFHMTEKHYKLWDLFFQECDNAMTRLIIFKMDMTVDERNLLEKLTNPHNCNLMKLTERVDQIIDNWDFVLFLHKSKLI